MSFLKKLFRTKDQFLIAAATRGDVAEVRRLLNKGANPNAKMKFANTPVLHMASTEGHHGVVQALLDKGANIEAKEEDGGTTALYVASYFGRLEVVRALLDKGADVNASAWNGMTALTVAGDDRVRTLLVRAAAVDSRARRTTTSAPAPPPSSMSEMGLVSAAERADTAAVQMLLAQGAAVNERREDGWTPLHMAATEEVAKLLLDHGADVSARSTEGSLFDGWTPLHVAAFFGHTKIAKLLLNHGADVNDRSNNGYSPLDSAHDSIDNRDEMIEFLHEHGGRRFML